MSLLVLAVNLIHEIGGVFSVVLSKENNLSLYIPDGYAHGFLVLSDLAIVSYLSPFGAS